MNFLSQLRLGKDNFWIPGHQRHASVLPPPPPTESRACWVEG